MSGQGNSTTVVTNTWDAVKQRTGDACLEHGTKLTIGCMACIDYVRADQLIASLDEMDTPDFLELVIGVDGPGGWPARGRVADAVNREREARGWSTGEADDA